MTPRIKAYLLFYLWLPVCTWYYGDRPHVIYCGDADTTKELMRLISKEAKKQAAKEKVKYDIPVLSGCDLGANSDLFNEGVEFTKPEKPSFLL